MREKFFLLSKDFFSKKYFFLVFFLPFLFINFFFSGQIFSKNLEVKSISEANQSIEKGVLPFGDVSNDHPARKAILELYRRNIITGYKDQTFRPNNKISRAEFVKIVLGSTNCTDCTRPTPEIKEKFTKKPFPDVDRWDWYFYCVSIGKDQKIITGYLSDGLFRPHKNISRGEAVAILLRKVGVEPAEYNGEFYDVKDDHWFKGYIKTAIEIGLISEKDGYVYPLEEVTRGEFAMITSNLLSIYDCREVDSDGDGIRDFLEKEDGIGPGKWGDNLSGKEEDFLNILNKLNNTQNLTDKQKQDFLNGVNGLKNKNNGLKNKNNTDYGDNFFKNLKCLFFEKIGKFEYQGVIKNDNGKIFSVSRKKFSDID